MIKLPDEFSFVDLNDPVFSQILDQLINRKDNLFINGAAGVGKSLLIKIFAKMSANSVILSTTGITALNLCSDDVKATTLHSFFCLPPVPIIPDTTEFFPKMIANIKAANTIVIDEAGMMSNQMFDVIISKIRRFRKSLPRFILFGDIMQLPPVIPSEQIVVDYYKKEYNSKVMFFNSHNFPNMDFKTLYLRKVYRQKDPEFRDHLISVGYNEHTQKTFDYFNKRRMSVQDYEKTHKFYVRLAPTNSLVNSVNAEYVSKFPGNGISYIASEHNWRGQKPNDDIVILKPGIQIMCLRNHINPEEGFDYRNGSIGVVTKLDPQYIEAELSNGKTTRISKGTVNQYEPTVDSLGTITYSPKGSYTQIDCKPMRACTIHKSQGKSIENIYIQLNKWIPEGLLYVALSRCPEIEGIGLNRLLSPSDFKYNKESWEFLEKGDIEEAPIELKDDEFILPD
jgi:hypothetical protein